MPILSLQPYLDHNGTLHVRSTSSGYAAKLLFKEPFLAFTSKQVHQVCPPSNPTCIPVPNIRADLGGGSTQHCIMLAWIRCWVTSIPPRCMKPLGACRGMARRTQVKGHVERGGRKLDQPQLCGKWDAALRAVYAGNAEQLLWAKSPPHEHPSRCMHSLSSAPPSAQALA